MSWYRSRKVRFPGTGNDCDATIAAPKALAAELEVEASEK